MGNGLPIPIKWCTPLAEMEWVVHAPLLFDGVLMVRVRKDLFRVRATDGVLLGTTLIDPDEGRGIICLRHRDCAIVDVGHAGAGKSEIIAVDTGGKVRWRTPLNVQLLSGTGALDGDELLVCGHETGAGNWLFTLDARTGAMAARMKVPLGGTPATALRWHPGAMLVSSTVGVGLRTIVDGSVAEILDERRVQMLIGTGDRALVAARPEDDFYEVAVYGRGNSEPRWRAPSPSYACAIDGEDVACVVGERDATMAAIRSATTGKIRWQSTESFEYCPGGVTLAGPVVLFKGGGHLWLHRRSDGHLLGDSYAFGSAATAVGDTLFIGGIERIAAADLSAV